MDNDYKMQDEKFENARNIIDKILPYLPDIGVFHFARYAKDVLGWSSEEIRNIVNVNPQLVHLALNQFQYINEKTKGHYYELNDKGREAKKAGGHTAYLELLESEKKIELNRQQLKDKSDKLDLRIKRWQVKTKYWPYIFSFVAVFISGVSYFKSNEKQSDLKEIQEKFRQLQDQVRFQDQVKLQDSLFRMDTLLTKPK